MTLVQHGSWLLGLVLSCLVFSASASGTAPRPASTSPASAIDAREVHGQTLVPKNAEDIEDQRRNEVRAYSIGAIKKVVIKNTRFYDSNDRLCPSEARGKLTPHRVKYFLKYAIPISQISLINYYGVFGECLSKDVDVFFRDGRTAKISFASESETAYLSSVVNGKEVEVYFYYCEKCSR